jgi:hypothetical protein
LTSQTQHKEKAFLGVLQMHTRIKLHTINQKFHQESNLQLYRVLSRH